MKDYNNNLFLKGFLCKDPTEVETETNTKMARLMLNVKQGKDDTKNIYRAIYVKCFNEVAEFALNNFVKGDFLKVEGKLSSGTINKGYRLDVIANKLEKTEKTEDEKTEKNSQKE